MKAWKTGIGILLIILITVGLFYIDCKDKLSREYRTRLQAAEEAYDELDQEMGKLLSGKEVSFETLNKRYAEAMMDYSDWQLIREEYERVARAEINLMYLSDIVTNYMEMIDLHYSICYSVYFPGLEPESEYLASEEELTERREALQGRMKKSFENLASVVQ